MRNFKEKRGLKHILQSKPVLVLLGVLILIFAWSLVGFMNKMQETARNRRIAEDKITQLEKQKQQLTSDINKLKTDEGVEESIREKFGLAKEGEGLIVIVDDKNSSATAVKSDSGGFFSWLKDLFK